jgi:carboxyl-terminal processing protease
MFLLLLSITVHAQEQKNHNLEVAKHLDIFNQLYKNLDLMYVDTLDAQEVIGTGIKAMLKSLDPYTEYFPEQKDLRTFMSGKYAGIGALIRYHLAQKTVVVDEPYEGTPAQEAGLKKGDVILAIDDSVMTGKDTKYVSERLRGDAGTTFLLKIRRPSTGKEMKMKITRRQIQYAPTVPYYGMREGEIGYISLSQFTEGCAQEVRRAFIDLRNKGMKALVLDLRGNGGGSEAEAVSLVNMFVPSGKTVVTNKGKIRQATHEYKTMTEPLDTLMPIVVLVNGESASASEITCGALQDLQRATVIGTRTYGKGLVQVPIDLPYNTNVKITTSRYYLPSGRSIQGTGVSPDVEVKLDTIPNIAYYLSGSGLDSTEVMFDYVVDYITRHPTIAPAAEFHLTDADYADFKQRVIKSGFSYDAVSKKQFDELVKTAKFEGYYDEARSAFDALEARLKHDVALELDRHEKIVRQMLESDIIAAYYYQSGTLEAALSYDKQLNEAVRVLQEKKQGK